jgi:DNA repair exonuclease SbcCD ATPase subunit
MDLDTTQSMDVDLDSTDRLPILEGVTIDQDVTDDAVRLEHTAVLSEGVRPRQIPLKDGLPRSPVALASRAESVRPAEERPTRQSAEYGALSRLYEKSRNAEAAAAERAETLLAELSAARAALAAEQHRSAEMQRELAERDALDEAARALAVGTRAERFGAEGAIAERDASIAELQRSLAERDGQLNALQREHAKTVPALEAQLSGQFETAVTTERSRAEQIAAELQTVRQSVTTLTAQLKRAEAELHGARGEFAAVKRQADTYFELLRTREFRRGFDENLFREWDAKQATAPANSSTAQEAAEAARPPVESPRPSAESARQFAELLARINALEADQNRLQGELAAREKAFADAAQNHEDELNVLMTHLNEARRPVQTTPSDVARLTEELALKTTTIESLNEDNRSLRGALERMRVALEEREVPARRVERGESANGDVPGRLQTSLERLDSAVPASAAPAAELSAELIKIDGGRNIVYPVGRRTRIGRAPTCELQLETTSVSRHHALLLKSARELVIEDLNSTNGVLVNGRKISRQLLKDGDLLTLGEVRLRCSLKLMPAPGAGRP